MSDKSKEAGARPDEDYYDDLDGGDEWEELAADPEKIARVLKLVEGLVPGILKRASIKGVGDALLSEDGLRSVLADQKKIPKEAAGLLFSQADSMRREILRIVSREIRVFLENVDFGGEIAKILTSVSFEIKTEIRFIPNDQAVRPQVKNKVKTKRAKDGSDIDLDAEDDEDSDADSGADASQQQEDASEGAPRKLRWGRRRKKAEPPSSDED